MTKHRNHLRRAAAAVFVAALFGQIDAAPAAANETESWQAREVTGTARRQGPDGRWVAVAAGDRVAAGEQIETDGGGRVVLARAGDSITVAPGSRLALPREAQTGTAVLQSFGTALFKVERGPQRRFEVRTPYMAAVVKGTTFTVTASPVSNTVHVVEGAVEVGSLSGGDRLMVRPGQTATMPSKPDAGVSLVSVQRGDQAPTQAVARSEGSSAGAAVMAPPAAKIAGLSAGEGRALKRPLGEVELDVDVATKGLVSRSAPRSEVARAKPQNTRAVRAGLTTARDQKLVDKAIRDIEGGELAKFNGADAKSDKLKDKLGKLMDAKSEPSERNPVKDTKVDKPKLENPSSDRPNIDGNPAPKTGTDNTPPNKPTNKKG